MRIADTRVETIQYVMPEHANPLGNLFGGKMMHWMTTAATLSASRFARGPVVLGSMDSIDFISPVHVGDLVILRSSIEWVGRSSMELCVDVFSENPETSEQHRTTQAYFAFVAIEPGGRPRVLPNILTPQGPEEEKLHRSAAGRKQARLDRMAKRRARLQDGDPVESSEVSHGLTSWRIVFPENAISSSIMFAGDLMMHIDEVGGILAHRYSRSIVVTASIDAMDFFDPIHVGDLLIFRAGLNLVGRTSMEIGVRVEAENILSGRAMHSCSAYLTFVALETTGEPRPVPTFEPATAEEHERSDAARARRESRRKGNRRI